MRLTVGLLPIVVLAVAFEVYCLVQVVGHRAKVLPRWVWVLFVVLSVPLGGIVYLVAGRGESTSLVTAEGRGDGPAPTDDLPPRAALAITRPVGAEPASTPAVRVTHLTKQYGSRLALDDVSLEVPRGAVFGMVGPNGAGKTTLLSILAGLRTATSGTIDLAVPRERIALLADTPSFEPWLTAREVVELARGLSARTGPVEATADALEMAGLGPDADRRTDGFSRGMLQRLGLAATIVGRPELLLLDEPCSALDPVGRREVLDLVGRLGGDHTVVFCSHILDDVQEVCDTVGVLRAGRVVFDGRLEELLVGRAAPAYTLRARPPLGPVADALARQPWVTSVEQEGAEVLAVAVSSRTDAETGLARTLADADARLISLVPSGADLERVFLELVR